MAPPLRQIRLSRHSALDCCRRSRDEHRVGSFRAGLADELWLEHVHVPHEAHGGGNFVRAWPSAYRQRRGVSDDRPRHMDMASGAAAMDAHTWFHGTRRRVPAGSARRNYSAVFSAKLESIRVILAEVITEDSFQEFEETLYFVGDCAEKCKTVLTKPNFVFLENIKFPSPNEMSALSYQKYLKIDIVDVPYFEPYYLKDFMITTSKK